MGQRGWESRLDKCAHLSKKERGWQGGTVLGFLFLHSAKGFSILPAGREANKKPANSYWRTLKRLKN